MVDNSGKLLNEFSLLRFYRRHELSVLSCLLLIGVVVVFLPSLRNDFVNYDDPDYVTENDHVKKGLSRNGLAGLLRPPSK